MSKCSYYCCLILLICLGTGYKTSAQNGDEISVPPDALMGAYVQYLSYYIRGGQGMPAGADLASDAVLNIHYENYDFEEDDWTAFTIKTDMDGKVCILTAGHNVEDVPVGDEITMDAFMKYHGRPRGPSQDDPSGMLGEVISGYESTLHPTLVAKVYNSQINGSEDWALLVADQDELPVDSLVTLGLSFDSTLYRTTPPGKRFVLAHPYASPLRISDSLYYDMNKPDPSTVFRLWPMPERTRPGRMGKGASGGPIINNNLPLPVVTGVYNGGVTEGAITIPVMEVVPDDHDIDLENRIRFTRAFFVTKTSAPALVAAVKTHCWNKEDSAVIDTERRYEKSVRINNTQSAGEFQQSRTITSQAGLEAAADQSYGSRNVNNMLVKAATLTVNCLINNKTGKDKLYCLAKQAVLEAGFSYLASGNKQLQINTVVPEPVTVGKPSGSEGEGSAALAAVIEVDSVMLTAKDVGAYATDQVFNIYPNPADNGVFYISFPVSAAGSRLALSSMEGKQVYQGNIGNKNPYKLELSNLSKGTYVLNIYHPETGTILFNKLIVYR